METYSLDKIFSALGHPLRRDIVRRLSRGPATITEIATPFDVSLNAVSKHLKVLEAAGLVERDVQGREHICRLQAEALTSATQWLDFYRQFWTKRLDAMQNQLLEEDPDQI
ncbi:MAG: metalloregulator ArsR/SmtB family transcription factor [Chloroflexi bacterium]|nr:metalloregulator ArsR/SmtB family transcription factor [Chloroflexota bacterium]